MIADMLEKRKRGLEDDSRPQIGEDYDRKVNDVLVNKEQEKIIQEYEKERTADHFIEWINSKNTQVYMNLFE